jgi:phospholipid-binding lipoprotein MlaA
MRPLGHAPTLSPGPRAGRAVAVALLLGLAGEPAQAQDAVDDPLEPLNRTIFSLNELLDLMFLEPASIVYGEAVPQVGRTGVRNFLDYLKSPVIFVNDLLQGDTDRAGVTLGRFMINTFFGFGLFDLASDFGYPKHGEDFGQTLAVWGVGAGPYLVLPLLGPSSVRDATGLAVDAFVLDPVGMVTDTTEAIARRGADGVDTRYRLTPEINDLRATSLDRYATVRTVYRQQRAAEIRNGAPPTGSEAYEEIFEEDEDLDDGASN